MAGLSIFGLHSTWKAGLLLFPFFIRPAFLLSNPVFGYPVPAVGYRHPNDSNYWAGQAVPKGYGMGRFFGLESKKATSIEPARSKLAAIRMHMLLGVFILLARSPNRLLWQPPGGAR